MMRLSDCCSATRSGVPAPDDLPAPSCIRVGVWDTSSELRWAAAESWLRKSQTLGTGSLREVVVLVDEEEEEEEEEDDDEDDDEMDDDDEDEDEVPR